MAKYEPLREYLSKRSDALPQLTLTFADVEALVGPLPDSARVSPAWWANDSRPETEAWGDAGWRVLAVDQAAERVVFARGAVGGRGITARTAAALAEQPSPHPYPSVPAQTPPAHTPPGQTVPAHMLPAQPPEAAAFAAMPAVPAQAVPLAAQTLDDLPDAVTQARAAWPDTAAPARASTARRYNGDGPPAGSPPELPDLPDLPLPSLGLPELDPDPAFGPGADRHTRRARRLAAHLDASLRAVTGKGFSDRGALDAPSQPDDPRQPPAESGPRTPHAATQPGRYGAGPLDPGIAAGIVESLLEAHLTDEGWSVQLTPDGRSADLGPSLTVTRHNRTLAIAVRGYPAFVPGGSESGEAPAPPPLRARQWYAQALLEAILVRGAQPDVDIALGLPDVPVYRALYSRSRDTFGRLNLLMFFAGADGRVRDH